MPGLGSAPAVLAGKRAFPKLEEKVGQLEKACRMKGRLKAGSEMNLLAIGKSLKDHIAATASSAGSEVGRHRGRAPGRARAAASVKGSGGQASSSLCSVFPAGLIPHAAVEAHRVGEERPEAISLPGYHREGKSAAEEKGTAWERHGVGRVTVSRVPHVALGHRRGGDHPSRPLSRSGR